MAALTNDQILDAIASMSVLEASELVKAMEEKFGVTAAVAVAAGPAAGGAAGGAADDEQTEFAVSRQVDCRHHSRRRKGQQEIIASRFFLIWPRVSKRA